MVIVTPVALTDADRFVRLSATHSAAFKGISAPWTSETIAAFASRGGAWASADDGGFILISRAADEAEILTVAVVPELQNRGLGRALLEAAMASATRSGAKTMFLEVAADNQAAIRLYQGCGFIQSGIRAGYYKRQGHRIDALTLRTEL